MLIKELLFIIKSYLEKNYNMRYSNDIVLYIFGKKNTATPYLSHCLQQRF